MGIQVPGSARLVFQGDSITDARRTQSGGNGLGHGYVSMIADSLLPAHPDLRVLNRSVSGNRVADLRARWTSDILGLRPDMLSVLVGVNDTWHRYKHGKPGPLQDFERDYRAVLEPVRAAGTQLVLIEPFLVPVRDEQWAWRADLDGRIQVVRRLARAYDAALLAADGLLNQAASEAGDPFKVTDDGVHLTPYGHTVLADAWCRLVPVV